MRYSIEIIERILFMLNCSELWEDALIEISRAQRGDY